MNEEEIQVAYREAEKCIQKAIQAPSSTAGITFATLALVYETRVGNLLREEKNNV